MYSVVVMSAIMVVCNDNNSVSFVQPEKGVSASSVHAQGEGERGGRGITGDDVDRID